MLIPSSPGFCLICRQPVTLKSTFGHLLSCKKRGQTPDSSFLMEIKTTEYPCYWLYLAVSDSARLSDIASVLSDIWLGNEHDSSFIFNKKTVSSLDSGVDFTMRVGEIFEEDGNCTYLYNISTPTLLKLTLKGMISYKPPNGIICVIARNSSPDYDCDICGNPAFFFCDTYYIEKKKPLLCQDCLQVHDCTDDTIHVIANSPHSGIEGYCEDPELAIRWYPDVWTSTDPIYPHPEYAVQNKSDKENNALNSSIILDGKNYPIILFDLDQTMRRIQSSFGKSIDSFLQDEYSDLDGWHLLLARETILQFLFHQESEYCMATREWDEVLIRTILVEHMCIGPCFPMKLLQMSLEILSGFFVYLHKLGYPIEHKPLIRELSHCNEKFFQNNTWEDYFYYIRSLFPHIYTQYKPDNYPFDPCSFPLSEYLDHMSAEDDVSGVDSPDILTIKRYNTTNTCPYNLPASNFMQVRRCDQIRKEIEEFCELFSPGWVFVDSIILLDKLNSFHFPLISQGEPSTWAGAIIYHVCKLQGLIKRGKSAEWTEKISGFFKISQSGIRKNSREIALAIRKKPEI